MNFYASRHLEQFTSGRKTGLSSRQQALIILESPTEKE
jgi:hypothetical protein